MPDGNHPFVSNLDSFTFNYGVDKTALRDLYHGYEPKLADEETATSGSTSAPSPTR